MKKKIVIEIDEATYNHYKDMNKGTSPLLTPTEKAIARGIVLPEKATNGDMIKALFADNFTINEYLNDTRGLIDEVHLCHGRDLLVQFDKGWWNAPYKRGETE